MAPAKAKASKAKVASSSDDESKANSAPISPASLKSKPQATASKSDAARIAAEEVEALGADGSAACAAKKQKAPDKAPESRATERQKTVEQNRLEAEEAQKRADAEKETLHLMEENKKLKAQLRKDAIPSTPSSSTSKPHTSNSARREKKVICCC
jgi:hypothetical protein